ncbi:hypothetical protein R3P38DRAFT_3001482 [Favolaschia claudopus]|uniref:Uncharacterized protein n=1 Tax=Favolaschia claudopus TaxID=2862362 RepID=A0AAW0AMH2_9AGAR
MLRPNPSLMMLEQCRLILVPIRSYHSSDRVLPHTILSFPFISRFTLGSYGSRTSPMNLPALLVDALACTATRPAGAMRTSSWSSSVHLNPPPESSCIPTYVSDSSPLHLDSRGSHLTWLSRSSRYSSYSLMLMTLTQPRHWTRRTQGSSGFTSTFLGSIPVHPQVPCMSDLFAWFIQPSVRPGFPGAAGDPINFLIWPCYIPADSHPHPWFVRM